jgi:hypothetical protein
MTTRTFFLGTIKHPAGGGGGSLYLFSTSQLHRSTGDFRRLLLNDDNGEGEGGYSSGDRLWHFDMPQVRAFYLRIYIYLHMSDFPCHIHVDRSLLNRMCSRPASLLQLLPSSGAFRHRRQLQQSTVRQQRRARLRMQQQQQPLSPPTSSLSPIATAAPAAFGGGGTCAAAAAAAAASAAASPLQYRRQKKYLKQLDSHSYESAQTRAAGITGTEEGDCELDWLPRILKYQRNIAYARLLYL